MGLPRVVVTGASGFVGRHLLERIADHWEIIGIARRSQAQSGAPVHPNISWHQVDIADRTTLGHVFEQVRDEGGADVVVHLAAHYDFTGEDHPEYWRTNIDGTRNVLDCSRWLGIRRFVFSSSLAACELPPKGKCVDERSPADGHHIYSRTKHLGEVMCREYEDDFPSVIVRFAAMFSDWCEYPPLYMFLGTWISRAWNRNVLGGHGESAVPYLHVADAADFLCLLLERGHELDPGEVLLCSRDGSVSHLELFLAATQYYDGEFRDPVLLPRLLVRPGIHARCLLGRLTGEMPFERPWMADYVDRRLDVDSSRSRARLGWEPRERREIIRRMPFLLENLRYEPVEWHRRNRNAMKEARLRPYLRIHSLLAKHAERICDTYDHVIQAGAAEGRLPSYQAVPAKEHEWNHRLVLRQLMNAVRTRDRSVFLTYCRDLAERRWEQGFSADELCGALRELDRVCVDTLSRDPEAADVVPYLHSHLTTTVLFACDQVHERFERMEARRRREATRA